MYRYSLHFDGATVSLTSPTKLSFDALRATAHELFPSLDSRFILHTDDSDNVCLHLGDSALGSCA